MTQSELTAIRREFINGNFNFLRQLYIEHKDSCIAILMAKKISTKEQAEDFFTDALLIFRDKVIDQKIEHLSNVKAYLTGTCLNLAKNQYSQKKKAEKKLDQVRLLYYENEHSIMQAQESAQELISICKRALNLLSKRCQEVLVAYYVHNLSMKEIAIELGLSSSDVAKTIKSRCHKAWMEKARKFSKNI